MSENNGHRKRLDDRINEHDYETLEPHEQLEHLLYAVIPRVDTNKIAHRLLAEFGSIMGVLSASPDDLMNVDGVGRRTAMFLASLPYLLGIVERNLKQQEPIVLKSTADKVNFVKSYFYGKKVENAYVVSLTADYKFKHISRLSRGVGRESESVVFVADVVKQALHDEAAIVFVVHNHPDGNIRPSGQDCEITRRLKRAFKGLDITFDDSIIISGESCFSMKDMGYLDSGFLDYE